MFKHIVRQIRGAPSADWVPILLASWASLFALGLVDNARGPIFSELISEFHLSDSRAAWFYLASSGSSALHNIIFHRFLSSAAPGRLIVGYTFLMGIGATVISFASTFATTLMGCSLLGIGFGGVGVAQNSAAQSVPGTIRRQAQGLLHSMYGLSSLLAPVIVASGGIAWRGSYRTLALIPMVVALGFLFRWEKLGHFHSGEDDDVVHSAERASAAGWIFAALVGSLVIAEISISSRMVVLARREWSLSFESASAWLSGYFVAMTVARLAIGLLKFKLSTEKSLFAILFMALPTALLALLDFGGRLSLPPALRLTLLCVFGFFIATGYPLAMVRLREMFGRRAQRITSLCVLTQSLFGIAMNVILGWLGDNAGILRALQLVTVGAVLLGIFLLMSLRTRAGAMIRASPLGKNAK